MDGFHLAYQEQCKVDGSVSGRPGIGYHQKAGVLKPGDYATKVYERMMGIAAFESALPMPGDDQFCLRFRSVLDPDTTIAVLWSADPLYDDEMERLDGVSIRVAGVFGHDPPRIHRDHMALVFRDNTVNTPRREILPLHIAVEPSTAYNVRVYLNEPNSDWEECVADPDSGLGQPCARCFDIDTTAVGVDIRCLDNPQAQMVQVSAGHCESDRQDSSTDRLFQITSGPGPDATLEIRFKHGGDNQGGPGQKLLDNVVYCYGVEVRPAGTGGGPGPLAQPGTASVPVEVWDHRGGAWRAVGAPLAIQVESARTCQPIDCQGQY